MADYGVDLACVTDLSEECRIVSGARLLAEALVRRLMTPRGMLIDDPDYGTDLREFLNEDFDDLALVRVLSEARQELLKDERVVDVTIVDPTFDGSKLTMTLAVEAEEGALRLTLAISDVTIDLLSVE